MYVHIYFSFPRMKINRNPNVKKIFFSIYYFSNFSKKYCASAKHHSRQVVNRPYKNQYYVHQYNCAWILFDCTRIGGLKMCQKFVKFKLQ